MFKQLPYEFEGVHLLAPGKEERYSYLDNGNEIGTIHLYMDNNSLYIDLLEVKEHHQKQGFGTRIVQALFTHFPQIDTVWGLSSESIMEGFWSKQQGFRFVGEGHDEMEGYLIFEITKP